MVDSKIKLAYPRKRCLQAFDDQKITITKKLKTNKKLVKLKNTQTRNKIYVTVGSKNVRKIWRKNGNTKLTTR